MRRRGSGEGSIFKDPQSGRWRALLDVGEDASGRRRRRKVAGRTRGEVAAKLRQLQRDLDDGVSADGRQTTVAALREDWLRQSSGELSRNTVDLRTWAVRQHLIPALGARRVRELSADEVASFLQDKATAGYSRASLDKMRGVLVQALRHAERQGLVVRNVAALVPTPAGPRAEGRSLTVAQAGDLLAAARGHPLEAAIIVGLTCGLRPGELLALAWDDVDLGKRTLRVQRALVRVGGRVEIGTTKTAASRRQLRLPAPTARAMAEHRTRQDAQRSAVGEHWQEHGLVFPSGLGTLLDPANLRRGLRHVTEQAGLGRWHPHELRHSAASLLFAAGVPLEEVADVLGHQHAGDLERLPAPDDPGRRGRRVDDGPAVRPARGRLTEMLWLPLWLPEVRSSPRRDLPAGRRTASDLRFRVWAIQDLNLTRAESLTCTDAL